MDPFSNDEWGFAQIFANQNSPQQTRPELPFDLYGNLDPNLPLDPNVERGMALALALASDLDSTVAPLVTDVTAEGSEESEIFSPDEEHDRHGHQTSLLPAMEELDDTMGRKVDYDPVEGVVGVDGHLVTDGNLDHANSNRAKVGTVDGDNFADSRADEVALDHTRVIAAGSEEPNETSARELSVDFGGGERYREEDDRGAGGKEREVEKEGREVEGREHIADSDGRPDQADEFEGSVGIPRSDDDMQQSPKGVSSVTLNAPNPIDSALDAGNMEVQSPSPASTGSAPPMPLTQRYNRRPSSSLPQSPPHPRSKRKASPLASIDSYSGGDADRADSKAKRQKKPIEVKSIEVTINELADLFGPAWLETWGDKLPQGRPIVRGPKNAAGKCSNRAVRAVDESSTTSAVDRAKLAGLRSLQVLARLGRYCSPHDGEAPLPIDRPSMAQWARTSQALRYYESFLEELNANLGPIHKKKSLNSEEFRKAVSELCQKPRQAFEMEIPLSLTDTYPDLVAPESPGERVSQDWEKRASVVNPFETVELRWDELPFKMALPPVADQTEPQTETVNLLPKDRIAPKTKWSLKVYDIDRGEIQICFSPIPLYCPSAPTICNVLRKLAEFSNYELDEVDKDEDWAFRAVDGNVLERSICTDVRQYSCIYLLGRNYREEGPTELDLVSVYLLDGITGRLDSLDKRGLWVTEYVNVPIAQGFFQVCGEGQDVFGRRFLAQVKLDDVVRSSNGYLKLRAQDLRQALEALSQPDCPPLPSIASAPVVYSISGAGTVETLQPQELGFVYTVVAGYVLLFTENKRCAVNEVGKTIWQVELLGPAQSAVVPSNTILVRYNMSNVITLSAAWFNIALIPSTERYLKTLMPNTANGSVRLDGQVMNNLEHLVGTDDMSSARVLGDHRRQVGNVIRSYLKTKKFAADKEEYKRQWIQWSSSLETILKCIGATSP